MPYSTDSRRWLVHCAGCLILGVVAPIYSAGAQEIGIDPPKLSEETPDKPSLLFDVEHVYGRYYLGDGLGVNCELTLEETHRFTFTWHGCGGEYDRNSGKWELDGDVLVLKPDQPNVNEGFQGVNVRFIPVKIGEAEFLIDEFEMPGFCAALAQKDAPIRRHGHDFVKSESEHIVTDRVVPVIPERFKDFYDKGAVEASVVRIDEGGNAVLDKGSGDRLTAGMRLEFNGFEASIELVVLKTSEDEAVAKPQYYWNSGRRAKVGDNFTTGGYWHRPRGTGFERFDDLPEREER